LALPLGAGAGLEAVDITLDAREEGAAEVALLPAPDLTLSSALFLDELAKHPQSRRILPYLHTIFSLLLGWCHSEDTVFIILIVFRLTLALAIGGTLWSGCFFEFACNCCKKGSASTADFDWSSTKEEPVKAE
jgi:hypothetical protein